MKPLTLISAVIAVLLGTAAITMNAFVKKEKNRNPDDGGHRLSAKWKSYAEARKADRPQKMAEILGDIKEEAKAARYHWDFYDAAWEKVQVESSRNWKLRQSLPEALEKEIEEYAEPIVTYSWRSSNGRPNLLDYVITSKTRLQAGRNAGFYYLNDVAGNMYGLLGECLKDDYEFALWSEYFSWNSDKKRTGVVLKDYLGDRYPNAQFLEYQQIVSQSGRDTVCAGLRRFAKEHGDRAIGLLAEGRLLLMKFGSLSMKNSKSDAFKALYEEGKVFEKKRSSFKGGIDGKLAGACEEVKELMETLEAKDINISFEDGHAVVVLRNVEKFDFDITPDAKGAKPVFKQGFANPENSFYVADTVKVKLPACDDADYIVSAKNGKTVFSTSFSPRTLSLAVREDSETRCFYVADYQSGKPIEKVDLELFRSGESIARVKDVSVDGFTAIPAAILNKVVRDATNNLVASCKGADGLLRVSKEAYLGTPEGWYHVEERDENYVNIFTDQGAYHPGETVKFKAVFYRGRHKNLRTFGSGEKVKVALVNTEGEPVGEKELATNEYGSVAGEFELPTTERNGHFRIMAIHGSTNVGWKEIVVDEYVLPTYDLSFEDVEKLFLSGDTVEVKGRLVSYSGHPLAAADVRYSVESYGTKIEEGKVGLAPDGSFSVRFLSRKDFYSYRVTVKVSDGTGETKEFRRGVYVLNYFDVRMDVLNASAGQSRPSTTDWRPVSIVSSDTASVRLTSMNNEGKEIPVPVEYELKDSAGKVLVKGTAQSGGEVKLVLKKSGKYSLSAKAVVRDRAGEDIEAEDERLILRVLDSDKVLDAKVENVFKLVGSCADGNLRTGEDIIVQFGAGDGPVWALAELFGDRRQLLERRFVHLDGKAGEEGSLTGLIFNYKKHYPDALYMHVFYFRNGTHYSYFRGFHREPDLQDIPLRFSAFENKTLPAKTCSFSLKSVPGVEAVAAVFDKSTEKIYRNEWYKVQLRGADAAAVGIDAYPGSENDYHGGPVRGFGITRGARFTTCSKEDFMEAAVEEEAVPFQLAYDADAKAVQNDMAAAAAAGDIAVRSDFATSLAFEPFLRSDEEGNISLDFKTSDKLSTFVVQVWAHDPRMQNATVRQEMVVTIPVKVSVAEPQYLYKGDRYVLHATVSSNSDQPVSGLAVLQTYSSKDFENTAPVSTLSRKVTVPGGGSIEVEFEVDPRDFDELGLKVAFADDAKTFSDGVFVSVPVLEAAQTITEAHSAVLLPGMDKAALMKRLASAFTGTSGVGAETREVDIRQMILDAIPSKVEPKGKDVLSLTEAYYVRKVSASLGSELTVKMPDAKLAEKILACRNADGGFGWFEGMKSSAIITAVVLERFAKLRDAGLSAGSFDPAASVRWLDQNQFIHSDAWPRWCGFLSAAEYAHLRSMFASVPFDVDVRTKNEKSEYSRNFKDFRKFVKDYLVPDAKDGRGLDGQILAKARRIKTLVNLTCNEGGLGLASKWGLNFGVSAKMNRSLGADINSLLEYAVEHRDGGWYYPNAVMPWRGLLESELYAHSLLCDLLAALPSVGGAADPAKLPAVADGIRLWMMLQKETQKWADDPAFVDAIHSVMAGGEKVLSAKVLALSKTYRKPFAEIVAAGNGFSVERHFYKEVTGAGGKLGRLEVLPGTLLHVGDKLTAEYRIWNQENRSFVKLVAPREASLRPVNQLSGHYGWWLRPLMAGRVWSLTPQGFRNVKSVCTEYYFDAYPEEKTTVSEEFFVTQDGRFSAPVITIESLYAPHYRANDGFRGAMESKK